MRQPTFFMAFDYDYTGNISLLDRPTVAFFASREVPSSLCKQALRWAAECCSSDRVVISGFQSPLEKELFQLLLRARHPVIWALGRSLYRRYPPEVQAAIDEGRILVFAVRNTRRVGWHTAQVRNFTIASLSDESLYALHEQGRRSSLQTLYELEAATAKPVRLLF